MVADETEEEDVVEEEEEDLREEEGVEVVTPTPWPPSNEKVALLLVPFELELLGPSPQPLSCSPRPGGR